MYNIKINFISGLAQEYNVILQSSRFNFRQMIMIKLIVSLQRIFFILPRSTSTGIPLPPTLLPLQSCISAAAWDEPFLFSATFYSYHGKNIYNSTVLQCLMCHIFRLFCPCYLYYSGYGQILLKATPLCCILKVVCSLLLPCWMYALLLQSLEFPNESWAFICRRTLNESLVSHSTPNWEYKGFS